MDYYSSTISTSLVMVNRALTNVDGLYMQLARYKPIQDVMLAAGTQRPLKELLKLQDNRLNYQDSTRILDALSVDYTHVLVNGKIAANGDGSLVEEINVNGYERFEKMAEA